MTATIDQSTGICYDIGRIAVEKFYGFAGAQVPEWLTKWITDTSLVELDIDEESIIRPQNHLTVSANIKSFS